jgi:GNAT superfamily N-acetyltransferase
MGGHEIPEHDPLALDRVERRFWADISAGAPQELASERGIHLRDFGVVQVTLITGLPKAQLPNLLLGAGEDGSLKEDGLPAAVEWAAAQEVAFNVPVTPAAPEAEAAEAWLLENGFEHGYAWMKFVRDASPPHLPEPSGMEIREPAPGEASSFGEIAARGFGLPEWTAVMWEGLVGRPGWRCYVASIDGADVACAATLIDGPIAEFGIAATLPEARGRGCQQGLLRRRILDAGAAGCSTLFVETGERVADRPSGSYRNILRVGFAEAYLRPNWVRPA